MTTLRQVPDEPLLDDGMFWGGILGGAAAYLVVVGCAFRIVWIWMTRPAVDAHAVMLVLTVTGLTGALLGVVVTLTVGDRVRAAWRQWREE